MSLTTSTDLLSHNKPPVMAVGAVHVLNAHIHSQFSLKQYPFISGQLEAGSRFFDLLVRECWRNLDTAQQNRRAAQLLRAGTCQCWGAALRAGHASCYLLRAAAVLGGRTGHGAVRELLGRVLIVDCAIAQERANCCPSIMVRCVPLAEGVIQLNAFEAARASACKTLAALMALMERWRCRLAKPPPWARSC